MRSQIQVAVFQIGNSRSNSQTCNQEAQLDKTTTAPNPPPAPPLLSLPLRLLGLTLNPLSRSQDLTLQGETFTLSWLIEQPLELLYQHLLDHYSLAA